MRFLEQAALHLVRAAGGFRLSLYLTRNRLRILCYHGFSVDNQHEISPQMFMRAAVFERRMRTLKRRRIPVISLDEAVRRLVSGDIRNAETVITLDDGWKSNLTIAAPILKRYGYPACVYVTTEHLTAGADVFNVTLCHLIRRSPKTTVHLAGLHPKMDGVYDLRKDPAATTLALINAAEEAFPRLAERQAYLEPIAAALEVDLRTLLQSEGLRLLSRDEILEWYSKGFDVQLHTHSHRLPDQDFQSMAAEIRMNRDALQEILGKESLHFCYPGGIYSPMHPEWLKRLGLLSATTCEPGLNPPGSSPMLLKRYLDSDRTTDIRFEAEVCGFADLVRTFRSRVLPRRSR
jgi:peptidoglycan/xylan/chitin deacetylase (PgdA/CDA1 family)